MEARRLKRRGNADPSPAARHVTGKPWGRTGTAMRDRLWVRYARLPETVADRFARRHRNSRYGDMDLLVEAARSAYPGIVEKFELRQPDLDRAEDVDKAFRAYAMKKLFYAIVDEIRKRMGRKQGKTTGTTARHRSGEWGWMEEGKVGGSEVSADPNPDEILETHEQVKWLRGVVESAHLNNKEKIVLMLRFGFGKEDECKFRKIGEKLGCTETRACQLLHQALEKIRAVMPADLREMVQ